MAKILTMDELAGLITRALIEPEWVDDADTFSRFVSDIAQVAADYLGADFSQANYDPDDGLGWTASFYKSESSPDDGGIFADYDLDAEWEERE